MICSRTTNLFINHSLLLTIIYLVFLFSACQQNDPPSSQQPVSIADQALFSQLSSEHTGISFSNDIPESSHMNSMIYEYFYNGGGVAVGDIDNDGLADIYFVSNLKENKLYKNKGHLQFEDISRQAGIQGSFGWSTGVSMADVNADGWLDIYVCKSGKGKARDRKNELFINNKNGTFTEAAATYGLDFPGYSTQASFFDYDRDGDLDMFLLNHNTTPINTNDPEKFKSTIDELAGDKLYRNDEGKFVDVTQQAGIINNPLGFGLGVSIGDLNNDGWPDIYVGNDYIEQDYLYINQKDGTFSETLKTATGHTSYFSMGTDIADFNNDEWPDIISLDMVAEDNYGIKTSMSGMNPAAFYQAVDQGFHYQYMFNALQLNNGNNCFSEIAHLAGISNTDWSWAPLFADFDNDGWKDLFISNGLKRDFRNNDFRKYKLKRMEEAKKSGEKIATVLEELIQTSPQRKTKNYFFKNNQDFTFSKKTEEWGILEPSFSNGAAYADLDNDGDLDLIINNIDEHASILENHSSKNYIQFNLRGSLYNQFGIGAKVKIETKEGIQTIENYPARGYQSSVSTIIHFGLGNNEVVERVEVIWPDGKQQILNTIASNQQIELYYKDAIAPVLTASLPATDALFKDITTRTGLDYQHSENEYDDFKKESLLPHKMSQFGPALAVGDINGDKLDDFFIGGAKGYPAELFFQQPDGSFLPSKYPLWEQEKGYEDVDAIFFDADNDGDKDLYVVSGGNEFEINSPLLQDRIYLNDGNKQFRKNNQLLPNMLASGSCVRHFDFDQDGDEDLFIGGRLTPGKYPFPGRSYILKNDGGLFKDITDEVAPQLSNIGMVTDAVWSDFNQDNFFDLIIVGEWMPITFFQNNNGKFSKASPIINESHNPQTGWWWSITAKDLDQDGDDDYIIGNLGLNYKYKATDKEPFEVFCHDFDDNGQLDIILGYYNGGDLYPLRGRECSSNQMPFLKEKFPTYHDFGSAKLEQIYSQEKLNKSLHYKATTFASVHLTNMGNDHFKIHPLPYLAQFSSINSIIIEDFNQDGYQDLIAAGNLYQSEVETARNDAGIGVFLKGNQDSQFSEVFAATSGLMLKGDVKALASIKLGSTGNSGILVAKNNDYLQLIGIYPFEGNPLTQ